MADIEVWCPCCSRWRRLNGDVHAVIAWRTGLSRRARLVHYPAGLESSPSSPTEPEQETGDTPTN